MNVRVFSSEQEATAACAAHIAAELRTKPELVLGLPTGRSPLNVYRELVLLRARGELDLSRATSFNLDEFLGMPPDDPSSFRSYMERHFFQHVNLSPERIHFLDGSAPEAESECSRYDAAVEEVGGLDVVMLGIGANGHIAFNEPGDALVAPCHRALLSRETRQGLAALFGDDASRVPLAALTMGMAALMQARQVLLLAFGASKAAAVTAMMHGPISPQCPASFLQLHRDVRVWLDSGAASGLQQR
ncbi:glucosamine-6-phosphate deaminase [Stigmatella aurantiaca]|uniref:Glucosamine-6-phosphate isomerase n=1 Tax=Stigmatella aurantiaca (strain DW4/3-1) TaxID=378806 RepID=Q09B22_STIAD|nr:glucosamine-6-phosphate deaminase [Stigmatella aurantiaca]ADO69222.1 Glucosamine-6-phosphate isomerase [Stigmatella aurantiaca DW4/3-1]EAU69010.1 glucosamine-6-phosphate isomerase/6-phosphogluconolactonase superfamily [Stigmatella aurantiaca DW4/3-1]